MPTVKHQELTSNPLQSRASSRRHLNPKLDPFFLPSHAKCMELCCLIVDAMSGRNLLTV